MQTQINHHEHEPSEHNAELKRASPDTFPVTGHTGEGGPVPRTPLSHGDNAAFRSKRTSALVVTRGRVDVLRESAGTDRDTPELSSKAAYFE